MHSFDEVDSTNRWLLDACRNGAPSGTVAIARVQTAGRGRLGRTWTAPPDSALLMSVLVRPDSLPTVDTVDQWHLLTFVLALAASRAIDQLGASTSMKWPNDVMAVRPDGEERKLAGILAQADHGDQPGIVLGIGVNLERPLLLPEEVAVRGVWLNELIPETTRPTAKGLADLLLSELGDVLLTPLPGVLAHIRQRCITLGRKVRVETSSGDVTGIATAIADDGALVVETSETLRTFHAGDVVHLR